MASTFSKIEGDEATEYLLLRSIRYRQAIPHSALHASGAARLSEVLSWMMGVGLIMQRPGRYALTEAGERRLVALAGSARVPLIDHAPGALKRVKRLDRVRIEASTAREIARRVSGDGNP